MDRDEILEIVIDSRLARKDLLYLLDRIRRLLAKSDSSTTERVESFLKSRSDLCGLQLGHAAASLHMSARTLSRKLRNEGARFHVLLTNERRERCYEFLEQGVTCGSTLAYLMGLSDISHFYKLFKKWFGLGFSDYKRNMAKNHCNNDMNNHRQVHRSNG